jgi:hypothetical protein
VAARFLMGAGRCEKRTRRPRRAARPVDGRVELTVVPGIEELSRWPCPEQSIGASSLRFPRSPIVSYISRVAGCGATERCYQSCNGLYPSAAVTGENLELCRSPDRRARAPRARDRGPPEEMPPLMRSRRGIATT